MKRSINLVVKRTKSTTELRNRTSDKVNGKIKMKPLGDNSNGANCQKKMSPKATSDEKGLKINSKSKHLSKTSKTKEKTVLIQQSKSVGATINALINNDNKNNHLKQTSPLEAKKSSQKGVKRKKSDVHDDTVNDDVILIVDSDDSDSDVLYSLAKSKKSSPVLKSKKGMTAAQCDVKNKSVSSETKDNTSSLNSSTTEGKTPATSNKKLSPSSTETLSTSNKKSSPSSTEVKTLSTTSKKLSPSNKPTCQSKNLSSGNNNNYIKKTESSPLKESLLRQQLLELPPPHTNFTSVKPLTTPSILPLVSNSINMESYFADIPTHQMSSCIPSSPSSISYKALLENLPQQMHPKKKNKKESDNDSEDGQIERRTSVRSAECAFRYKDIIVKKCKRYTQIWLNTQTKLKNALNPQVMQEIVTALNSAKYDDSNLVMISSIGNVFCSGVDLNFLVTGDPKIAARKMSDAIRELVRTFITFPKPIVAVVSGAAIGLGMAILPLCDITYASDKALFYLPYCSLSQTPEACSSFTLPQVLGMAVGSETLFCGRKLTALEANQFGLVSQVFWPTSMMQEVIPRMQQMAMFSGKALETTKLLIRCQNRTKLELANDTECNLLTERWPTTECQRAIQLYLDNEKNFRY